MPTIGGGDDFVWIGGPDEGLWLLVVVGDEAIDGGLEIDVLPLDVPADAECGGIRSELEAAGKPIGGNDLLIAAQAYAIGATIVTANTNEFKRTRGRTWRIGSLESGWFRKSKSIKT